MQEAEQVSSSAQQPDEVKSDAVPLTEAPGAATTPMLQAMWTPQRHPSQRCGSAAAGIWWLVGRPLSGAVDTDFWEGAWDTERSALRLLLPRPGAMAMQQSAMHSGPAWPYTMPTSPQLKLKVVNSLYLNWALLMRNRCQEADITCDYQWQLLPLDQPCVASGFAQCAVYCSFVYCPATSCFISSIIHSSIALNKMLAMNMLLWCAITGMATQQSSEQLIPMLRWQCRDAAAMQDIFNNPVGPPDIGVQQAVEALLKPATAAPTQNMFAGIADPLQADVSGGSWQNIFAGIADPLHAASCSSDRCHISSEACKESNDGIGAPMCALQMHPTIGLPSLGAEVSGQRATDAAMPPSIHLGLPARESLSVPALTAVSGSELPLQSSVASRTPSHVAWANDLGDRGALIQEFGSRALYRPPDAVIHSRPSALSAHSRHSATTPPDGGSNPAGLPSGGDSSNPTSAAEQIQSDQKRSVSKDEQPRKRSTFAWLFSRSSRVQPQSRASKRASDAAAPLQVLPPVVAAFVAGKEAAERAPAESFANWLPTQSQKADMLQSARLGVSVEETASDQAVASSPDDRSRAASIAAVQGSPVNMSAALSSAAVGAACADVSAAVQPECASGDDVGAGQMPGELQQSELSMSAAARAGNSFQHLPSEAEGDPAAGQTKTSHQDDMSLDFAQPCAGLQDAAQPVAEGVQPQNPDSQGEMALLQRPASATEVPASQGWHFAERKQAAKQQHDVADMWHPDSIASSLPRDECPPGGTAPPQTISQRASDPTQAGASAGAWGPLGPRRQVSADRPRSALRMRLAGRSPGRVSPCQLSEADLAKQFSVPQSAECSAGTHTSGPMAEGRVYTPISSLQRTPNTALPSPLDWNAACASAAAANSNASNTLSSMLSNQLLLLASDGVAAAIVPPQLLLARARRRNMKPSSPCQSAHWAVPMLALSQRPLLPPAVPPLQLVEGQLHCPAAADVQSLVVLCQHEVLHSMAAMQQALRNSADERASVLRRQSVTAADVTTLQHAHEGQASAYMYHVRSSGRSLHNLLQMATLGARAHVPCFKLIRLEFVPI